MAEKQYALKASNGAMATIDKSGIGCQGVAQIAIVKIDTAYWPVDEMADLHLFCYEYRKANPLNDGRIIKTDKT